MFEKAVTDFFCEFMGIGSNGITGFKTELNKCKGLRDSYFEFEFKHTTVSI